MSTPTPRTSSAIIASGFQAVPEGFRAFAGILERELTALTAERDKLRAQNDQFSDNLSAVGAVYNAEKARAERAEADLAKERARLDWLESPAGMDWQWQAGITRATIDAKMQKDAK